MRIEPIVRCTLLGVLLTTLPSLAASDPTPTSNGDGRAAFCSDLGAAFETLGSEPTAALARLGQTYHCGAEHHAVFDELGSTGTLDGACRAAARYASDDLSDLDVCRARLREVLEMCSASVRPDVLACLEGATTADAGKPLGRRWTYRGNWAIAWRTRAEVGDNCYVLPIETHRQVGGLPPFWDAAVEKSGTIPASARSKTPR